MRSRYSPIPVSSLPLNLSLLTFAVACLCLLFTGCRPEAAGPDSPAAKPRIALIMKSLANEFFLTMENGARAHQKAHSDQFDLIANGIKDELDVGKQVELVEQMIAQKVDAIVIAPADSKALVPVCKKAQQAGIIVINIDNQFDTTVLAQASVQFPFVGPDNRKGAQAVAEHLAQQLQPGDPVAIIEGAPNAFNAVQRKLGFEDAINAAGLKLVSSQSGFWETDRANRVAAAVITENPNLKAFLCANDSMALGAVAALRAAGKLDQVLVVGYDNIAAVKQLLQEGRVLATVDQHADRLAVFGIEYALETLKTRAAPADRETPVDLITKDTLTPQ
jgi:ribose transport system substrate-binding protein